MIVAVSLSAYFAIWGMCHSRCIGLDSGELCTVSQCINSNPMGMPIYCTKTRTLLCHSLCALNFAEDQTQVKEGILLISLPLH